MKKAGGILGLIGGIFGVFAALFTLLFGGVASAFHASGAATVVGLGWGGLGFAFLAIIMGAVCLGAESRWPAVMLAIGSVAGALLGGTLVAICMILSLVGGVLAFAGTRPAPGAAKGRGWAMAGGIASLALILGVVLAGGSSDAPKVTAAATHKPVSVQAQAAPPRFHVGDTFQSPTFRMTVSSATVTDEVGSGLLRSTPASGGEYLAVAWSYTNISGAPVEAFQAPSLELIDRSGHVYDADLGASSSFAAQINADSKVLSNVNPGITITDGDVFEVSKSLFDASTWKLRVTSGDGSVDVRIAPPATPGHADSAADTASGPSGSTAAPAVAEGQDIILPGTIRIGHDKLAGGSYTYVQADQAFVSPCDGSKVRDVLLWNSSVGDPQILKAYAGQQVLLHGQIACPASGIQFSPASATHP